MLHMRRLSLVLFWEDTNAPSCAHLDCLLDLGLREVEDGLPVWSENHVVIESLSMQAFVYSFDDLANFRVARRSQYHVDVVHIYKCRNIIYRKELEQNSKNWSRDEQEQNMEQPTSLGYHNIHSILLIRRIAQ
jgi:hypothetical protein